MQCMYIYIIYIYIYIIYIYIYNGGYLRLINATQTQNEVLVPLRFPTTNFASEIIHQSRQKKSNGKKQLVVKLKQLNWNNSPDFLVK